MHDLDENTITQAVIARLSDTPNARLKDVLTSLVQHLHSFAREVRLSEEELMQGLAFLTAVGQQCDEKRQEFILLSDTLGLSMLTVAMNEARQPGGTEATVFGPFHVDGAPEYPLGADISNGASGLPCFLSGTVRSTDGTPLANARIEVWQADADGFYDVQYPDLNTHRARGVLHADAEGRFHFRSIVAEAYPIPHDGPVGSMLKATARHPWRPAHVHFMIKAPGYAPLITHVFRKGDRFLESDAVFGVRSSLVADWQRHEEGLSPYGESIQPPFYTLHFDFMLSEEQADQHRG